MVGFYIYLYVYNIDIIIDEFIIYRFICYVSIIILIKGIRYKYLKKKLNKNIYFFYYIVVNY